MLHKCRSHGRTVLVFAGVLDHVGPSEVSSISQIMKETLMVANDLVKMIIACGRPDGHDEVLQAMTEAMTVHFTG